MSGALWDGRRFRTFNVIEDFSRAALAVEVSLNLPAANGIRPLERIAAWRGAPPSSLPHKQLRKGRHTPTRSSCPRMASTPTRP